MCGVILYPCAARITCVLDGNVSETSSELISVSWDCVLTVYWPNGHYSTSWNTCKCSWWSCVKLVILCSFKYESIHWESMIFQKHISLSLLTLDWSVLKRADVHVNLLSEAKGWRSVGSGELWAGGVLMNTHRCFFNPSVYSTEALRNTFTVLLTVQMIYDQSFTATPKYWTRLSFILYD